MLLLLSFSWFHAFAIAHPLHQAGVVHNRSNVPTTIQVILHSVLWYIAEDHALNARYSPHRFSASKVKRPEAAMAYTVTLALGIACRTEPTVLIASSNVSTSHESCWPI